MNLRYEFDKKGNSPADGHNNPLRTIFSTSIDIVAREAFQNSIDAANSENPVHIEVSLEKAPVSTIPCIDSLKKILAACGRNKSATAYYNHALELLKGNEISFLRISDSGTTGLTGADHEKEGKYYNFFKAEGGTNKADGEAGAYGYGKSANIAFSAINTFFASSTYLENNEIKHVFMGVVKVCTHELDGIEYRGVGSFGKPGQLPVRHENEIPKFFRRKNTNPGTDIIIPAYKGHKDWKETTIKSALKNFWLAILENKLAVTVGDEKIDSANIEEIIKKYFPQERKVKGWKSGSDPTPYLKAYKEGEKIEAEFPNIGKAKLYILPGTQDNSTGHVECFRKSLMLIQTKKFESIIPFTGVLICDDKDGNAILQKMEPPQHNYWSSKELHAQDVITGEPLQECIDAEKEYKKFIQDNVNKLLGKRTSEKVFLSSVDRHIRLSGKNAGDSEGTQNEEVNDNSTGEESVRRNSLPRDIVPNQIGRLQDIGPGPKPPDKKCSVCNNKPCTCPCKNCGEYPCVCLCDTCGENPCVCPCKKCHQDPCICQTPPPGGQLTATVRQFPEIRNGSLITNILIRLQPAIPHKAIRVLLKAGTDSELEVIAVSRVSAPASINSKGHITDLISDADGIVRFDVEFSHNKRYSIGATIYEA